MDTFHDDTQFHISRTGGSLDNQLERSVAYEKKTPVDLQGQMNLSKIKEEMRNFDTHAPLKTAKEVSPVAHRIQLLMHMALELDHRGLESVIACATFHRRYPKGA